MVKTTIELGAIVEDLRALPRDPVTSSPAMGSRAGGTAPPLPLGHPNGPTPTKSMQGKRLKEVAKEDCEMKMASMIDVTFLLLAIQ